VDVRRRHTICGRCIARIALSQILLTVCVLSGAGEVLAQGAPANPRWSISLVAPPDGAPLVAGGMVAVPLQSGSVVGHRIDTGEQAWRIELDAEQPLAADAERFYIAAGEAIHAIEAKTGAVSWRAALGGAATAPPLANGGWVIVAVAGELMALRAGDGTVVWHKPVGDVVFRPALDGDLLIVALRTNHVLAVDLRTGERRWESRDLGAAPLEPFVIGDRVYVGTEGKAFLTLLASNGRIESPWKIGALTRGSAAIDDRHVYFVAMDNTLRAIDRGNGNLRWRKGVSYRPGAGPVISGGAVAVPARDVTALQTFDSRTGAATTQMPFTDLLAQIPVFFDGPGGPSAIGVTGNLQNQWTLRMLEPAPLPSLALEPLTTVPGDVIPLPILSDK
jgi:outer membrane protein assembly factor BamB